MEKENVLEYLVHPLVLLNVSDHFNRNRLQNPDSSGLVFGALMGIQSGSRFELFTSFEIKVTRDPSSGQWILDTDLFTQRLEQYKVVFPDYDFLGWYSTSITDPLDRELELHRQFMAFNELPLYGRLDPTLLLLPSQPRDHSESHQGTISSRLPFIMYESRMDPHVGFISFSEVFIKVDMGEAERIAVEGVAKDAGSTGGASGPLVAHLTSQRNALDMLHVRIKTILNYVQSVQRDLANADHALLRHIASITHQLPTIGSDDFAKQFTTDYNDVLLSLYLTVLTKTTHKTNDLVDRHLEATTSHSGADRGSFMSMGSRRGGRHGGAMVPLHWKN